MSKIRYEIDPHNRLTILGPNKFRTIIDGEFKLSSRNSLIYHVKKSDNIDVPQQIKFRGNWSLDKEHNLIFTLNKWNNQCEGNKLVLESDLVSASGNELVFSIETKDSSSEQGESSLNSVTRSYILKFSGAWQADKYNRLSFNLEREKGESDALTLQGIWTINKQNEIIYSYIRTLTGTKEKIENSIALRGYWDISEKDRLIYILNEDIDSQFDLKVSFQKAEKNFLRYTIGVGYAQKTDTITLSGKWKLDKNLGLLFEVEYADGCVKQIVFGADCKWNDDYSVELRLKNKTGEDLGIEVSLSKQLFQGQGEAFVKALACEEEFSIMAGAGWKW